MKVIKMSMQAQIKEASGKGISRRLRNEGMVPATLYGSDKETRSIAVNAHDLMMAVQKGGFFTNFQMLAIDGKEEKVLPRDLQRDPVNEKILHADFLRFNPKQELTVNVSVHVTNEDKSPGVKLGGMVQLVRPEIELVCRADSIPDFIEVSVEGLEVGESAHISSVTLPEGVRPAIQDRDFTVASIITTRTSKTDEMDAEADAEAAAAAEGAEGEEGAPAAEAAEGEAEAEGGEDKKAD